MAKDAELKLSLDLSQVQKEAEKLPRILTDALNKISGKGFADLEKELENALKTTEVFTSELNKSADSLDKIAHYSEELTSLKDLKMPLQQEIAAQEQAVKRLQNRWYAVWQFRAGESGARKNRQEWEAVNSKLAENKQLLQELEGEELKLTSKIDEAEYDIGTTVQNTNEWLKTTEELVAKTEQQSSALEQSASATNNINQNTKQVVTDTKDTASAVDEISNSLGKADDKAKDLSQDVKEISNVAGDSGLSNIATEAEQTKSSLSDLVQELSRLNAQREALSASGESTIDTERQILAVTSQINEAFNFDKANASTLEIKQHLNEVNSAIKTIETMDAPTGLNRIYGELVSEAAQASNAYNTIKATAKETGASVQQSAINFVYAFNTVAQAAQQSLEKETTQAAINSVYALNIVAEASERDLKQRATQSALAYVTALNAISNAIETDFQTAMQDAAETIDRVSDEMQKGIGGETIADLTKRLEALARAKKDIESYNIPDNMKDYYNQLIPLLERTKQEIKDYKNEVNNTPSAIERLKDATSSFASSTSKAMSKVRAAINGVKSVFNKIISIVNKVASVIKGAFNNISKLANKVKSAFNKMSHSMNSDFKHLITNLTKYVFGFRSLFFLVRRLRSGIKEGLQNLVQFAGGSNEVNRAISALMSSVLYLKNAWAAAFSPIITYVMPVLTMLIDKLAEAGNAIARFIATLTGQATVFQAVKVDAGDYAKSLQDAGSSAGGAAKKQKQLNDRLAAFDDLNVLGKDKDPTSSGSGGGGGAGDLTNLDPNEMFKIVPAVSNLADMIKQAWTEGMGDFSDLGTLIGTKIKEGLDKINWTTIQAATDKLGKAFGSLLKGAFSVDGIWESIGVTIGEGLNTAIGFMHNFLTEVTQVDWGGGIATALNSSIKTINWDTVWEDIQLGANSLAENINSLFANLDLTTILSTISSSSEALTSAIVTLIDGINWDEIVSSALLIGDAILEGIQQGLSNSDNPILQTLGSMLSNVRTNLAELLPQLSAIFDGIDIEGGISALSDGFNLMSNAISSLLPLIEPLKGALSNIFGSVGEEFTNLVSVLPGLQPAMENIIGSMGEFYGNLVTVIGELLPVVVQLSGAFSPFAAIMTDIITAILPVLTSMFSGLTPIITAITDNVMPVLNDGLALAQPVLDAIADVLGKIFETGGELIARLLEIAATIGGDMMTALEPLSEILITVLDLFISLLDPILDLLDPLLDLIEVCLDPMSLLFQLIGTILSITLVPALKLFSAIVKAVVVPVLTFLVNKIQAVIDIIHSLSVVTKALRTLFSNVFNGIKSVIYSVVNSILGAIEKFANGIVRGFNKVIDGLNSINFTIPDWVPDYGGESIGLNLSKLSTVSIPRLAQGAVIPPNKEFMAVLGDQSSGTNIEAPLDTIKQAVAEELSAQLDVLQNGFASVVQAINNKDLNIGDKQIGMANARYNARQNLIRGTSF